MEVYFHEGLSSQIGFSGSGILASMYPYTMVSTLFSSGKGALYGFYLHRMGGAKILILYRRNCPSAHTSDRQGERKTRQCHMPNQDHL